MKALAFRLLASAAIEDYVEKRCVEVAKLGCDRFKKGQPSSTGRAIVTWSTVRTYSRSFPIHEGDVLELIDVADEALKSYLQSVKSTHGMSGRDLTSLVYPLGLRQRQVPPQLVESLNALSTSRDPASHVYVNRAKSMVEPIEEWRTVDQVMKPLAQLDDDLSLVVMTHPLEPKGL
jgi:hypothetical protein